MLLWFALIFVGIVVIFWLIGKASDSFNKAEMERQEDIRNRWYDERDKAVEEAERRAEEIKR